MSDLIKCNVYKYLSSNINCKEIKISENKATIYKKNFVRLYHEDQIKNYPFKIVTVSLMSYIGGCFFGIIMLAFSMLGSARLEQSIASLTQYDNLYKNRDEFKVAMKQRVIQPIHRNGYFVVRLTLAIGIFNAIIIYLPFENNRFGDLYGLGNMDTIFYFLIPYFIIFRVKKMNMIKRSLLSISSISFYKLNKLIFETDSNRKKRMDYLL